MKNRTKIVYVVLLCIHFLCTKNVIASAKKDTTLFQEYFENALIQYASLPNIDWIITYADSVTIDESLESDIEAVGYEKDTAHYVEFTFSLSSDTSIIFLLNYVTVYSVFDTVYHTEYDYDAILIPRFKYKFTRQNPENIFFEYGEDNYKYRHSHSP